MKFIITFALACIFVYQSNGQISELNDDINLGSSDIAAVCALTNGWGATHGSPTYAAAATSIWMFHANTPGGGTPPYRGEGVYRSFNFIANTDYRVELGINDFKLNSTTGRFKILLVNNFTPNCVSSDGSSIPDFPSARTLYTYNDGTDLHDKHLTLQFSLGNGESYSKIVIYPEQISTGGSSVSLEISCLAIYGCGNITNSTFCNSSIPSGNYYQQNAYIGSTYCSSASLTQSVINATTQIHAQSAIDIKPNTDISIQAGTSNIFLLDIVPTCQSGFPLNFSTGINGTVSSIFNDVACGYETIASSIVRRPLIIDEIRISPNPAIDFLKFEFNRNSTYAELSIINSAGQIVSTMKKEYNGMEGRTTDEINISQLPPGMYILRIRSGSFNKACKFVIAR